MFLVPEVCRTDNSAYTGECVGLAIKKTPYKELQIFDAKDNDTQIIGKSAEESSVVFYPIPAASLANARGTRERPRWKD